MTEPLHYALLRGLAEDQESVDVPATVVRELLAERDRLREWIAVVAKADERTLFDLLAERDRLRAELEHEGGVRRGLARLGNTLFEEQDEALAERDRLRGALAEIYFHLGPPQPPGYEIGHEGVPALVQKAMAERDRLRVVTKAAYAWRLWEAKRVTRSIEESQQRQTVRATLIAAIDTLEVSDIVGRQAEDDG